MASDATLRGLVEKSKYREKIKELLGNPSAALISLGEDIQPNCHGTATYVCDVEDLVRAPSDDEVKRWCNSEYGLPIDEIHSTFVAPPSPGPGYLPDVRFMYFLLNSNIVTEVKPQMAMNTVVTFWQHYSGEGDALVHSGIWLGRPDKKRVNMFQQEGAGNIFELVSEKRIELPKDSEVRYFRVDK
jgi:hypothetical protein